MLLSIIIVNYNGHKFLEPCLNSIKDNLKDIEYEIIVVDNDSKDQSVSLLKNKFPEVILLDYTENLGFAKGNNIGVKHSKGKFVLLLNNDTVVLSPIHELLSFFQDTSIGAVSIRMIGKDSEYRKSAGHYPNAFRLLKISSLYKNDEGFHDGTMDNHPFQVDWLEASFLLTTRDIWDSLNGMNEDLFMYGEDLDFCKRLSDKGLKLIYFPMLSYIHYGGYNASREELLVKGLKTYNRNHMSLLHRMLSNASIDLNSLVKRLK